MTAVRPEWTRIEPHVFVGSTAGGDLQFTEGFTTRWARRIIYGVDPIADTYEDEPVLWAVVDSTYYGSRDEGITARIEACYEITVCTDRTHPGDNELQSWNEYQDVESDDNRDVDCSDATLRRHAEQDEAPTDEWWNHVMDRNNHSSGPYYYLAVTG